MLATELALVIVGGGLGTAFRYLTSLLAARLWGSDFPWGTLIVNLAGSFAIGLIYALGVEAGVIGTRARLFLMTGLLGGLTTFSSLTMESSTLLLHTGTGAAVLNLLVQVLGGLLLFVAGMLAGRAL